MFEGSGLAISLPASELSALGPASSLFGIEQIRRAPISDDLRTAINVVLAHAGDLRVVFIARPEVFTNSASLGWLTEKLAGIANHLCISDGLTIRVVPGLRNHMFLYRLGIECNAIACAKLLRRVPEFIGTMAGQVNTALTVKLDGRRFLPPTLALPGLARADRAEPQFYPFFLNRNSAKLSAERSFAAGSLLPGSMSRLSQLVYIPLTEVAARDRQFAERIGVAIREAYFDTSTGIILRLPFLAKTSATIAEGIALGLEGLCVTPASIPRLPAENIVFTNEDLDTKAFHRRNVHILAHETFDFWRHPPAFYSNCRSVTVHVSALRRPDSTAIRAVLRGVLGRAPEIKWVSRDDELI